MGLIVNVYRTAGPDCTMGGISADANRLCLVNVPGPFNPSHDAPAAHLQSHVLGCLRIVPDGCNGRHMMMGGNYAATSDSRFSKACRDLLGHDFYGAVAIHDRYEG